MSRMIFPNLPVEDLQATREFWGSLGFTFNDDFSDDNAACLVLNDLCSVMLLRSGFFHEFHKTQKHTGTEVLIAIGAESREEVDDLCSKAASAGATDVEKPEEQGPMYGGAFRDLDGHLWEVFWMDPSAMG